MSRGIRAAALSLVVVAGLGLVVVTPGSAEVAKPPKPPRPVVTKVKPSSGPVTGGVTVKVKGKDLAGASKVLFGKTQGTQLKVKSARKLTVVAPAQAAGQVDVRVVTRGGKSKKVPAGKFTYLAAPAVAPTVSAVAPTSGTTAGGTQVTVTGSGFTGVTGVTFGGVPGTAVNAASATQLTVRTPAHAAGAVDVRVTTSAGTSTASPTSRFTFVPMATTLSFPADIGSDHEGGLQDVSCATTTCAAVGSYSLEEGAKGLIQMRTATSGWTALAAPLPGDTKSVGGPNAGLVGVSCPTTTYCLAVGFYADTTSVFKPLLVVFNGTTWAPLTATAPGGALPTSNLTLSSVDCTSAGACVAVGSYDSGTGSGGLIVTVTGGTATGMEAPAPTLGVGAALVEVDCPAPGACAAVGTYMDPTVKRALMETQVAGTWSGTQLTLPGDAANPPVPAPFTVACRAAGSCVATGDYTITGGFAGYLARLGAGTWTSQAVPAPANAQPAPFARILGLDCVAAGDCVGFGSYQTTTARHGLLMRDDGTVTTPTDAPLPAGSPTTSFTVDGIDMVCAGPTECAGIGQLRADGGSSFGLLESQQPDGSWVPVAVASSVGGTNFALGAIDNDSPTTAVAVGRDPGAGGDVLVVVTGIPL